MKKYLLVWSAILVLVATACVPATPEVLIAAPEPTATVAPTYTPYPTCTPYPTYTPVPSPTPIPTNTPTPSPTAMSKPTATLAIERAVDLDYVERMTAFLKVRGEAIDDGKTLGRMLLVFPDLLHSESWLEDMAGTLAVFIVGPAELQSMVPPPALEEYHAEVTVSAGYLRSLSLLYAEWIDEEDAIGALEEGITGLNLANDSMDRASLLWDAFLNEDA